MVKDTKRSKRGVNCKVHVISEGSVLRIVTLCFTNVSQIGKDLSRFFNLQFSFSVWTFPILFWTVFYSLYYDGMPCPMDSSFQTSKYKGCECAGVSCKLLVRQWNFLKWLEIWDGNQLQHCYWKNLNWIHNDDDDACEFLIYFLLHLKRIWSLKNPVLGLQSFAVCPSGPTEYCGRNWLSSHLMALGLAQQGCNRSGSVLFCLTHNSLERPQRHWISPPESMKKNNRLNQVYHIKDTRNCTKTTTSHVKLIAVQKKLKPHKCILE